MRFEVLARNFDWRKAMIAMRPHMVPYSTTMNSSRGKQVFAFIQKEEKEERRPITLAEVMENDVVVLALTDSAISINCTNVIALAVDRMVHKLLKVWDNDQQVIGLESGDL